jgi:hypothetical protein
MSAASPLSKAATDLANAFIDSKRRAHSGIVLRAGEIIRGELLREINVQVNPLDSLTVKRVLGSKLGKPSDFYIRI